jgi:uncharacterized protein YqgV (UPF0045/DUF77 family)
MRVTVEISLYPLRDDFVPAIREFIVELRRQPGIELLSNQMSTQLRGDFEAVMAGLQAAMTTAWTEGGSQVFVMKFLNADLPIASKPQV